MFTKLLILILSIFSFAGMLELYVRLAWDMSEHASRRLSLSPRRSFSQSSCLFPILYYLMLLYGLMLHQQVLRLALTNISVNINLE